MLFSPCDIALFVNGEPKEYHSFYSKYSKPRFFDYKDSAILSVRMDSIFQLNIMNLQKKFIKTDEKTLSCKSYIYENDTIPIYTFLEYKGGDKLHNFCDHSQKIPLNIFYNELNRFCDLFCMENNLSRIIFMLPDYTNLHD